MTITYPQRTEALTDERRYEKLLRRLWFFLASVIPHEWRDETISRWMKDDMHP